MATDSTLPLLRWLASLRPAPSRGVLACAHTRLARVPAEAVAIQVSGCLRTEELVLPAQLLASGLVSLDVVACAEHPDEVEELVAGWSRVLDGIALAPPGTRRRSRRRGGPAYRITSESGSGPAVSRRLLIGLGRPHPSALDLTADEPARSLEALRLLQAEGRAHQRETAELPASTSSPVAVLLSAGGCVACGVCVAACAHGALAIVDEDGTALLRQLPDRCRADQACVRLCPSGALSVTGELSVLDLARTGSAAPATVELARVEVARCQRCGTRHPVAEGELCPPCAFRAEHPFGSVGPHDRIGPWQSTRPART